MMTTEGRTEVKERALASNVFDAVYGCLIGGAIGDALEAAVENWHYSDIRAKHGKVDRFLL
jgi:ADP-ribosylglycohydrolase